MLSFHSWSQTSPERGKRRRNIWTPRGELAQPLLSMGPWPFQLPDLVVSHSPSLQQTAGLVVNIFFIWALVIQRANTGFQGYEGNSLLKCLRYFLFAAAHANGAQRVVLCRLDSSSFSLDSSTHHFLQILPVVSSLWSHLALTQVQPSSEGVYWHS